MLILFTIAEFASGVVICSYGLNGKDVDEGSKFYMRYYNDCPIDRTQYSNFRLKINKFSTANHHESKVRLGVDVGAAQTSYYWFTVDGSTSVFTSARSNPLYLSSSQGAGAAADSIQVSATCIDDYGWSWYQECEFDINWELIADTAPPPPSPSPPPLPPSPAPSLPPWQPGSVCGPVTNWVMTDVEYDMASASILTGSTESLMLDTEVYDQLQSPVPITATFTLEKEVTKTSTFELVSGAVELQSETQTQTETDHQMSEITTTMFANMNVGVEASFTPFIKASASAEAGIENVDVTVDEQTVEVSTASTQSLQTSTQTTEGETTTDRTTITRTFTREVPGCSRFEVRLEAKQYVGVVPFEASMTPRNPSLDQLQQCTYKITGSWRGSDVFNTKITSDSEATLHESQYDSCNTVSHLVGELAADPALAGPCLNAGQGGRGDKKNLGDNNNATNSDKKNNLGLIVGIVAGAAVAIAALALAFCYLKKKKKNGAIGHAVATPVGVAVNVPPPDATPVSLAVNVPPSDAAAPSP